MSGEMILAISVGLAMVACGVLAYWGTLQSFSRSHPKSRNKPERPD